MRVQKTWVSDTYALRQARYMQLPPAKIERPFRKIMVKAVESLPRTKDAVLYASALKALRTALRPAIQAAKRGDGGFVKDLAWRVLA